MTHSGNKCPFCNYEVLIWENGRYRCPKCNSKFSGNDTINNGVDSLLSHPDLGEYIDNYLTTIPFFKQEDIQRICLNALENLSDTERKKELILAVLRADSELCASVMQEALLDDLDGDLLGTLSQDDRIMAWLNMLPSSVKIDTELINRLLSIYDVDDVYVSAPDADKATNAAIKKLQAERNEQAEDITELIGAFESYVTITRKYGTTLI